MEDTTRVIEYKCPCCNAGLVFGSNVQKLTCEYCDNTFEIDAVLDDILYGRLREYVIKEQ